VRRLGANTIIKGKINAGGGLLENFDVFGEWFQRKNFEAIPFSMCSSERNGTGPGYPLRQVSIDYLADIRGQVKVLTDEAGLKRH
jgi:hypothetical protein